MQAFDPLQYKLDYPQFANISDIKLTQEYNYNASARFQFVFDYFMDANQQYYWSCIVLSHILILAYGIDGTGSSGLIGRIASASEFDVSTTTDYAMRDNGSNWWNQTQYGASIWSLFQQHTNMQWVSGC